MSLQLISTVLVSTALLSGACNLEMGPSRIKKSQPVKSPAREKAPESKQQPASPVLSSSGRDVGSIQTRTAPSSYYVTNWTDFVPREPMWFINAAGANHSSSFHPEENIKGTANWWRGDRAITNLLGYIDEGYSAGARWFFINRPMGTVQGQHVPAGSWLTLEEKKRADLARALTDAMLDRYQDPVHIVWFVGSEMADPRSLEGWSAQRNSSFYELGSTENWRSLVSSRTTLGGWISTGASGLAIDHSAPDDERDHFVDLFHQLIRPPFGLTVIGEALPLETDARGALRKMPNGTSVADNNYMTKMPWVAIDRFYELHWPLVLGPSVGKFDERSTRAFIWLPNSPMSYGNPQEREVLIDRYMARGLIPITGDVVMFRRAKSNYASASGLD